MFKRRKDSWPRGSSDLGEFMVIALIGRSYSGKERLAKAIQYNSNGEFKRLQMYTTKEGKSHRPHIYVSKEDFGQIVLSDILWITENQNGDKFFFSKSQVHGLGNTILIADDPVAVEALPELGVPYGIAFVDCSDDVARGRADEAGDNWAIVKARYDYIRDRLDSFRAKSEFSLHLDTSTITTKSGLALAGALFHRQCASWDETRKPDEVRMPMISDYDAEDLHAIMRVPGMKMVTLEV